MRARMRERQSRMETAASMGEMRSIMVEVPASPTRLEGHQKYLKVGRKLGAEARWRPRVARFTEA